MEINKKQDKRYWTTWRWDNYRFYENVLKDRPDTTKILDLGSGEDPFKDIFKRFDVTRVDFKDYGGIDVITDITKPLPLDGDVYDVVIASNIFEHVPHIDSVLSECFRILKKGGTLYATVPFIAGVHQRPYDFGRYTDIYLEQLLAEADFAEKKIIPLGDPTEVVTWILKKHVSLYYGSRSFILVRVLNKILKILLSVYPRLEPNMDFTIGYAIIASKK